MAKSCPECARPNGDDAVKCLYCATPLEAGVPMPAAMQIPEPSPPPRDAPDWHLVILVPTGAPDDLMVQGLAQVCGVSAYDARLGLTSTRPRVFRRVDGELAARTLSEQLKASRVPHYVVSERSIRAVPVSRAQSVELRERHLEANLDGRALAIPYEEVLLLVRGEITRESHNENKIATPKGANRALSPGLLMHLYSHDASVAVEVDPEAFIWPGGDATQSALLNLERFLDAIEGKAPGVPVDRSFDLELPVLSRSGGDGNHLAQVFSAGSGRAGVLYDNADQFRFYARWRYRLERHLRQSLAENT